MSNSVLVVDDNSCIRAALRAFLEDSAHLAVCGEAADGIEAVAKAKTERPTLVLMDLSMPHMNGLEAACAIKASLQDARIVVFTLHSEKIGKALTKSGAVDLVVSKSEGAQGLTRALRRLLPGDDFQAPPAVH